MDKDVERIDKVVVDPKDKRGLIALMDDCKANPKKYETYLIGESEHGERVLISVNEDNIVVETWQENGWVRKNYYYRDPLADNEEIYDGKWK